MPDPRRETAAHASAPEQASIDLELVAQLRAAAYRYIDAIDAWEAAYQQYYRLPDAGTVSPDLAAEQREFVAASEDLRRNLPYARRLCLKHSVRDPFAGLLHVNLGAGAPQSGAASAIGRAERKLVSQCLDDLDTACRAESNAALACETRPDAPIRERIERSGIFHRIVDFFL